ncbi:putative receptor protein kinase ZmPK1 [Phragmites australis]|uniref:putative receptor protein kinase ZmPK1 n=1 Tax=Phragmites australis TaxID=29695 RepID=UPI002D76B86D|nr:putative receptor protein kinase ZmPK1 [Phragmites australis]
MDAHSTSLFLTLIHLLALISARNSLTPGSSLSVESSSDVLRSPDGTFTCGFDISSNAAIFSIWFSNSAPKTVVWSANHLHPVYTWGSRVELDIHGIMVVKDYNGQTVWTNNVSSSDADRAQLLDTGNLVVKGKGDVILWQSFDSPTDTLLPNQNITAATKLVVPDHYSFHFDDQHLLTLFDDEKNISFIYWPNPDINIRAKQRNSFNSTTIGVLDSSGHFLGSDNLSFSAADSGPGIMRRLTLDYDGNLRLYSMQKNGTWLITWMAYPQLCYVRGLCGMNGICVYTPAPACTCAPGYEAIDPSDGRKGCKPKHRISCDGKQKMGFVKLPNTDFLGHDQDVQNFVSLHTCKNICTSACSCMGFSYMQGHGDCYIKSAIVGGVTHPALPGSIYLKLPEAVRVLQSSIPHSQPFGPEYGSECGAVSKNVTTQFLDTTERSHSGPKYWYAYGFLSAIFLVQVTIAVVGWWFILRREGKQLRGVLPAEVGYEMITNHFRRYTYRELQRATRKFRDELGKGASGVVYKGVLEDKREVAVKKLADIHQGEAEFQHELSVIRRIYHMNLVRIWGFCSDGPHRMLVSEFVENGSLDKILFCTDGSPILLEWKQRFKIALGVAKGLAYLHHECLEWVIHCDVKPENILLDKNLEPKITDFGLAKLLNRGGSNKSTSRICGTRGYIAPEWVSSLPITAKVDVYSFGVVLLELLKGARVSEWVANADEAVEMAIRRIVRMLEDNAKIQGSEQSWIAGFIDPRLNGHFNGSQARTMIKLAVSCVQEDRSIRPTMENVVQMLLSVDEAGSIIQQYSLN